MPTKTVQPGICRFDLSDTNAHGFMARLMRRGVAYQEFFSDADYGSQKKAKAAAIARREEWLRKLPAPATPQNRKTVRNSSGKVGVHLARDVDLRTAGRASYHYVASWRGDDGKRINLKFSWRKHGQKLAWQLAVVARENKLRDRDRVQQVHARRTGRFPPVPEHPDIEGALRRGGRTSGRKPVAKSRLAKTTRPRREAASEPAAARIRSGPAKQTPTTQDSAPKKKASVRKSTPAKTKAKAKKKPATRKPASKKAAARLSTTGTDVSKQKAAKKKPLKKRALKTRAVKKTGAAARSRGRKKK